MHDIVSLTADYEAWLGRRIPLVGADLERKHRELASDPMRFLRGTYYLWLLSVPDEVLNGPDVPSVGDLHVENFGTWLDAHGVRRWGVNDLDELAWAPYALDLVRLATSALLSPHLAVSSQQVCDTLLTTWRTATTARAVDLTTARARHLLAMVPGAHSAMRYYAGLAAAPESLPPPPAVVYAVARSAPNGWRPSWHTRVAGTGSLGHPRLVAVAGTTAREVKLLGPPTDEWAAEHRAGPLPVHDAALLGRVQTAVSGPDPLRLVQGWVLRRLGPDVVRIDLTGLAKKDTRRLLRSMARAVTDVHGTQPAALTAAREHEATRKSDWLHRLASTMAGTTHEQFTAWAAHR